MPPCAHVLLDDSSRRTGDFGEDVPVPSDGLLKQDPKKQDAWCILTDLVEYLGSFSDLSSILVVLWRDVVEVLYDVVGVDVMTAMCRLPREVRSKEGGMQCEADCVVESRGSTEARTPAVVCDHPQACPYNALCEGVGVNHGVTEQSR